MAALKYWDGSAWQTLPMSAPTADVSFNGYKAILLGDPTSPQDAATKAYVDSRSFVPVAIKARTASDFSVTASIPATVAVTFDTIEYSTHGTGQVNGATGVITLPLDGYYVATAQWMPGANVLASPTTIIDLYIETGGVRVGEERRTITSASQWMVNASAHFSATAGQSVQMKAGCNKGGTVTNGAGSTGLPTYLAVARIA